MPPLWRRAARWRTRGGMLQRLQFRRAAFALAGRPDSARVDVKDGANCEQGAANGKGDSGEMTIRYSPLAIRPLTSAPSDICPGDHDLGDQAIASERRELCFDIRHHRIDLVAERGRRG